MGMWFTCSQCKHNLRFGSMADGVMDTGSEWRPRYEFECPSCGTHNVQESQNQFFTKMINMIDTGDIQVRDVGTKDTVRDPGEMRLQAYIKAHAQELGLARVEGPFRRGPDFKGVTADGLAIDIEAETVASSYIQHKHPDNPTFADVQWLIVLTDDLKGSDKRSKRKLLPPIIKTVDSVSYSNWSKTKESRDILRTLGFDFMESGTYALGNLQNAFTRRWFTVCSDKGRDASMCPDCADCIFFNLPTQHMAAEFIAKRTPRIEEPKDLADVTNEELDQFFYAYIDDHHHLPE